MRKPKPQERTHERYDKKAQAFFYFNYDFSTKLEFLDINDGKVPMAHKYPACSKNVSAEGLCFTSLKKLNKGDNILLELTLKDGTDPVHMVGEVRWSQSSLPGREDQSELYDTGVKLLEVEGHSVPDSIHYDEGYHVIWSAALESILGKYKEYIKQSRA